jgi:hypothetical protein
LGVASLLLPTSAFAYGVNVCDFDGDGKTDHVVARDLGGTIQWWVLRSLTSTVSTFSWGVTGDEFVCGDFDGDGSDDAAVWRATPGTFWVRLTAGGVVNTPFGLTGDDPSVIGDYDGDGKDDMAIYRPGAVVNAPSSWWYLRSSDSALIPVAWGKNGDIAIPGDFSGDGKADFTIQRSEGGAGRFWRQTSTGAISTYLWGTATDLVIPTDYTGDGRADTAISRIAGSSLQWWILNNNTGLPVPGQSPTTWGLSGDTRAVGDYDGDGLADLAVWRAGVYWVRNSATSSTAVRRWGTTGDVPVASFNAH